MMRYILIAFSFIWMTTVIHAQGNTWKTYPQNNTSTQNKIEGSKSHNLIDTHKQHTDKSTGDCIISLEILKQDSLYTAYAEKPQSIKGYTILIYSGSGANSKSKALKVEKHFQARYRNGETYLAWKSPNYEVRLGDYRNKTEAQHNLRILKREFQTAFIKKDMINLPPLEAQSIQRR